LHADVVAVELDRLDLAHPDAGDPHLVALPQPAGLAELRDVRRPAADHRQVARVERAVDQGGEHEQPDQTDRERVALAERCEPALPGAWGDAADPGLAARAVAAAARQAEPPLAGPSVAHRRHLAAVTWTDGRINSCP